MNRERETELIEDLAAMAANRDSTVHERNKFLRQRNDLRAALEDVTAELSQLHSHYHPACEGGCPTVEYIMNARKAIFKANGG